MLAEIVQWETEVSAKCDNLQRLCIVPSASNCTEHNGMKIPYTSKFSPLRRNKPYRMFYSDLRSFQKK